MRPAGHVTTWAEFSEAFREHHISEGLMDRKREEFCSFTQGRLSVDAYSRSSVTLHDMQLRKSLLMQRSKQGSARDLALSFAAIFVCTSAPPSRSWSIRPSVLRQDRLTMMLHASTPMILALHPALDLRSAGCGFQARHCHPGSFRGHPLRHLVPTSNLHRPSTMVAPLLMLLHAPML